jgi:hypothetical protein
MSKDNDASQISWVLINEEDLKRLESNDRLLKALKAGGVDNWGGYWHATKDFYTKELEGDWAGSSEAGVPSVVKDAESQA